MSIILSIIGGLFRTAATLIVCAVLLTVLVIFALFNIITSII